MGSVLKRTKIVATLSGRDAKEEFVRSLYEAGVDMIRLNSAHVDLQQAPEIVRVIRGVSDNLAIMLDTKGPEVRTCAMAEPLVVEDGQEITVGANPDFPADLLVNYRHFVTEVPVGAQLLIDDGLVELRVIERAGGLLKAQVVNGGSIAGRKSVNVPNVKLKLPALSIKDRQFIDFAIAEKIDFIAHSFVRSADDVKAIQSILDTSESSTRIIAKIENREGVRNLSEILEHCAGVMVARGDLGVEIPLEEVPRIQKDIILECMNRGKVVITATQMLQSMVDHPRPTRAEVSDVANAVLDGTDAVMLSGETAAGKYPLESVRMMTRIVRQMESTADQHFTRVNMLQDSEDPVRGFIIKTAIEAARQLPVKAVVCNTASGNSARLLSAYRAMAPVYAFCYDPVVSRSLALNYGVYGCCREKVDTTDEALVYAFKKLLDDGAIGVKDLVVVLGNHQIDTAGANICAVVTAEQVLNERGMEWGGN